MTVPVKISSTGFIALQAEITMPEGMTLNAVTAGAMANGKNLRQRYKFLVV